MKVNDTVICVNAEPNQTKSRNRRRIPGGHVVEGEIYKITGFTKQGGLLLTCKRVMSEGFQQIGWRKDRFQPYDESKAMIPLAGTDSPVDDEWD